MIDLSYLIKTTNNDKEVIMQLIDIFKSQLPELKENIIDAYKNKNWTALKEASHKAKNSFQMMGLEKTASKLKQIEIECTDNNNPNIDSHIKSFLADFELITLEVKNGIEI
ncbi:MAG: Hpt domain-containing protein [Bacteroidales bacterium]|nr:Hpt domain-containing protein [Bacteroidales bacterium]MBN2756663.1 Hpt domain-containing protein [Bacteroidales bacterium]